MNSKLKKASTSLGTSCSNVVIKNHTPGPFGNPWDGDLVDHFAVENPGRCQPERSPNRPPSFRTPRSLSGKLLQTGRLRARSDAMWILHLLRVPSQLSLNLPSSDVATGESESRNSTRRSLYTRPHINIAPLATLYCLAHQSDFRCYPCDPD